MKDGVIKNDGTSRLIKANLPATYEQLRVMAENGTLPVDILFNAAGWDVIPDFLNKANLLQDYTATQYGLDSTATVNDIFMALKMPAGYYGFEVNATFQDGTPASGLELKGLLAFDQSVAVTDENGFCYAMSTESAPVVDFTDYLGIVSKTETIQAVDGQTYTPVEITVEKDTEMYLLKASCKKRSYAGALLDFCAVGGGGGGSNSASHSGRGGGGGGYAVNKLGVQGGDTFTFTVGSGGAAQQSGGTTSIVKNGETFATASGGGGGTYNTGGSGNGNGGYTTSSSSTSHGGDGSVRVFNDESLPLPGGGGGGGIQTGRGGKDFGGNGVKNGNGGAGTGPGGGGGGCYDSTATGKTYTGGSGHAGAVYVRARFE